MGRIELSHGHFPEPEYQAFLPPDPPVSFGHVVIENEELDLGTQCLIQEFLIAHALGTKLNCTKWP